MRNILFILLTIFIVSCASTNGKAEIQPTVFVKQALEPTGGEVEKPKDWFYAERHRATNSLNWIISKEDPIGAYETGLSIQFMIGVKDGTGLTPQEFIKTNMRQIVKSSVVIDYCGNSIVGDFTRSCLKVSQTQMREGVPVDYIVLYSFFWDNNKDLVGITVAGTPTKEWHKYSSVFDRMANIKIIDPSRFR